MKQKFTLIAISFLLAGIVTMKGAVVNEYKGAKSPLNPSGRMTTDHFKPMGIKDNNSLFKKNTKAHRTANEATVEVTCIFNYDETKFVSPSISCFSSNYQEDFYPEEGNQSKIQIPVGTYDFLVTYFTANENEEAKTTLAYIVKEDIEITTSTTLEFAASDATNLVRFRSVDPNGNQLVLPTLRFFQEEPWYEITDPGNVDDMGLSAIIAHDSYGVISTFFGNAGIINAETGENGEEHFDFLINDVSQKYHFIQIRTMPYDKGEYIVTLHHKGITDEIVCNDPKDYVQYTETFDISPAREKYGNEKYKFGVGSRLWLNNVQVGGGDVRYELENPEIHICAPLPTDEIDLKTAVVPTNIDVCYSYEIEDWGTEYASAGITGLPVIWNGTDFEYVNNNHSECGNFSFQVPENPDNDIIEYPGHQSFTFMSGKKTVPYGNSSPINVVLDQTYYNDYFEYKISWYDCCYLGRLGEIRGADLLDLQTEVKYNGETVCNSYDEFSEWLFNSANEKKPLGLLEITFNNNNVKVDGIDGYNKTFVRADKAKEDGTAPTLQMLQFKNTQGDITDRFKEASLGILEFTGGDFNFHSEDRFWFDCKEQTVKVEYSPYGTDLFTELTVNEVPELFFMPGFGYFYRASLQKVSQKSENGWFDLRITLTDTSGNSQEQTISPAFKVDNLTGITNIIATDMQQSDAEYYTTQGLRVENPVSGNIYIVRRGNNVTKELIKN